MSATITEAIELFLTDVGRGHSPRTAATYKVGLHRFTNWLTTTATAIPDSDPITTVKSAWAVDFLRAAHDGSPVHPALARSSLMTYAAALTCFYRWCSLEEIAPLTAEDFSRMQLRFKDIVGRERRTLLNKVPADAVVEALIAQVAKTKPDETPLMTIIRLRDTAIVHTLSCSGARVSELVGLLRGDLDVNNRRGRVVGKGEKERWLYFSTEAWDAISTYLAARTTLHPTPTRVTPRALAAQPVFARHDRGAGETFRPITSRSVQYLINRLATQAEHDGVITPHSFRHWVATRILAATSDLAVTQDLLGHASPMTTRIYAQTTENAKRDAHRRIWR